MAFPNTAQIPQRWNQVVSSHHVYAFHKYSVKQNFKTAGAVCWWKLFIFQQCLESSFEFFLTEKSWRPVTKVCLLGDHLN